MKLRKRGVNFGSILEVFWQSKTANLNRAEAKAAERALLMRFWKKSAGKGTHVRGVEKKGKSSMTKPKSKPKSSKTPFTKKVIRTT